MHPNNPYCATPPNFAALADSNPALKPFLIDRSDGTTRVCIDFKNPEAIRQLSIALLKQDFDLDISLPPDRLCPMKQSSIFPVTHMLALPSRLAFTMCNPPFYTSREEIAELSLKKDIGPASNLHWQ
ncbi:hypothetical protein DFH28DRAFT_1083250 [Melampsora americana]|nr:hypothetical protein DFH28DRAFT_1083250 [Melampsora americana]